MPHDKWSSSVTREQAALLLDVKHFSLIELLLRGEVSAAEVARQLGLPIQRAHDRLRRFVAAGLAVVAREEKRAGRAVKRYTSAQAEWFVPFERTSADTLTDLFAGQVEPRMRRLYENLADRILAVTPRQGVVVGLRDEALQLQVIPDELDGTGASGGSPLVALFGGMRLAPARARVFREQLATLLDEFSEDDPHGAHYGLCVFFLEGDPRPRP